MYANGFLEQKKRSPAGLATVIGLHAAALGAVMVFGTTTFVKQRDARIDVFNVPIPPPPPVVTPPPPRSNTPQQVSTPTVVPPVVPPIAPPIVAPVTPPTVYQPPLTPPVQRPVEVANLSPVIPPVRRTAQVDPNYRDALQPPYPRIEEVNQREGRVQVRITIGTNGRVIAIDRLSATTEGFWQVTQRQALNRWRFRPATVDGRPVESTMVFTVTFRLPEA